MEVYTIIYEYIHKPHIFCAIALCSDFHSSSSLQRIFVRHLNQIYSPHTLSKYITADNTRATTTAILRLSLVARPNSHHVRYVLHIYIGHVAIEQHCFYIIYTYYVCRILYMCTSSMMCFVYARGAHWWWWHRKCACGRDLFITCARFISRRGNTQRRTYTSIYVYVVRPPLYRDRTHRVRLAACDGCCILGLYYMRGAYIWWMEEPQRCSRDAVSNRIFDSIIYKVNCYSVCWREYIFAEWRNTSIWHRHPHNNPLWCARPGSPLGDPMIDQFGLVSAADYQPPRICILAAYINTHPHLKRIPNTW